MSTEGRGGRQSPETRQSRATRLPTPGGEAPGALQGALDAEHAAVYGYGVVGAYLSGDRLQFARACGTSHRAARGRLRAILRRAGASPTPADADYALPREVTGRESAVALATTLEERVSAAYGELVAAAEGELRTLAAREMRGAAVRAARWRGSSVPFPGLPDAFPS